MKYILTFPAGYGKLAAQALSAKLLSGRAIPVVILCGECAVSGIVHSIEEVPQLGGSTQEVPLRCGPPVVLGKADCMDAYGSGSWKVVPIILGTIDLTKHLLCTTKPLLQAGKRGRFMLLVQ